jgi:hypothetical protein
MSTGINIAPSSDLTVGTTAVTSGTDGRVFFQAGGVVQQDGNFTYDNTLKRLGLKAVGTAATDIPLLIQDSAGTGKLFQATGDGKHSFNMSPNTNFSLSIDQTNQNGGLAVYSSGQAIFTVAKVAGSVGYISVLNNGNPSFFSGTTSYFNHSLVVGGNSTSPGARLDVRAQGALSTDIAFRVRNSADSANILTVQGNGTIVIPSNPKIDTTAGTFIQTNTFGSLYVGTGNTSIANYTNIVFGNSNTLSGSVDNYVVVGSANSINGMRNIVMGIGNTTSGDSSIRIGNAAQDTYGGNSSIHLGRSGNGGFITYSANEVFNVFFNDYRQSQMFRGNGSLLLSGKNNTILTDANVTTFMGDGGNTLVVRNHTSVPSTNITDSFQQYSADITAGNAAPHFRTENGSIVKLYQEAAVTTSQGIATALANQGLLATSTIVPTVQSVVSAATVTPVAGNEEVVITAQAAALTIANPTGTWYQGQDLIIRIKDDGTGRAITWDTNYRAIGVTLPTTTVANKLTYVGVIYNSTDSKWDVLGVSQEA